MAALLSPSTCARCERKLQLGDKVLPIWVVSHSGKVHAEAEPTRQMAHVTCPKEDS